MEDKLNKLRPVIRRGTLRQFYSDASAKVAPLGYTAEFDGEFLTFSRVKEEKAGLLGMSKRQVKTKALKLSWPGPVVVFDMETVDPEFVDVLLKVYKL
jgi:hypothetical protein